MPKSVLDFNVKGSGGEIEKYLPEQNAQRIQQNAKAIADIAGGGEVNTMSNEGTGVGLFWQKDVLNLELNNLKSENDRLSIALDGVSHDVEFTVNEGNIDHNALANYAANQHFLENAINLANINEKNHVSLTNKNAEANIKHLTDAQLAALHNIYTNAQAVAAVEAAGLALDNAKVITSQDADLLFIFGRTCIGTIDYVDYAAFSHRDRMSAGNWAILQNAAGRTLLNASAGQIIVHKINNVKIMDMTVAGLQIGTDARITEFDTAPLANSDTKVPTNTTVKEYADLKATAAEAIAAVLADDKYVRNYENDVINGTLTVNSLTTSGMICNGNIQLNIGSTVDGVDISTVLNQNVKNSASPAFVGLTLSADLVTSSTIDGVDLLALKTDYDAKINQAVKTTSTPSFTGLISNGNISMSAESTVDGVDVGAHAGNADAHHNKNHDNTEHTTNYLANVVEDLTPQLGGNLDLVTFDIKEGAVMLYDISARTIKPDKILLSLGSTIDKFDSDVNLAGDNTDVPTSLAVKTYVDASIDTHEGNPGDINHLTDVQVTALHPQLTNLTELATRNHNDLLNIDAGDINHLTDVQVAALHAKQHAMDDAAEHTSTDIATLNSSTTKHGFLKKLDNNALNYMNGQGNWTEPAGAGGVSEATVNALLGIGIANKRWKNCLLEGAYDNAHVRVWDAYRNVGADDMWLLFGIPLDYIIGGTHNLVITRFKIGISDADEANYVARIRMYGWSDHDSGAVLATEDADRIALGEYITDHADVTLGGNQERVNFMVETICTNAQSLDITYLQVEYYYT